jgi:hypothetical protein
MSETLPAGEVRAVVRELLDELLPEVVGALVEERHDRAVPAPPPDPEVVPQVPAPPVATVHRPSGWSADGSPPAAAAAVNGRGTVEQVTLGTDAELQAFVQRLLRLFENPRDRDALRAGRLRFALRSGGDAAAGVAPALRIEKRAVTERVVDEAAAAGVRLVLGPGAVLTPMARDRAKQLRVEIEKEGRC